MTQRFFYFIGIISFIIFSNSLASYAQEPEIKSNSKYYDRSIINRILSKEKNDKFSENTSFNIRRTIESPNLSAVDGNEINKFDTSTLGVCDIFDKDDNASFSISLKEAVEMSLNNNIALNIEKIDPEISSTHIEEEKSEFDKSISASISASDKRSKSINADDVIGNNSNNGTTASIEAKQKSVSGVKTNIGASVTRSRTSSHSSLYATRLGIDITAPLMRGAGKEVNLVSLRKAELDLDWSRYEFYGYVIDFV